MFFLDLRGALLPARAFDCCRFQKKIQLISGDKKKVISGDKKTFSQFFFFCLFFSSPSLTFFLNVKSFFISPPSLIFLEICQMFFYSVALITFSKNRLNVFFS